MTIDPTAALEANAPSSLDPTTDPSLGLVPINQATLPADVRNGSAKQKQDYAAALEFEQMLVSEMTQAMSATTDPSSSSDGSDDSDSSDTDDSSDGTDSSDPITSMYQQMLPDVLADAVTSAGGVGLADELYKAIEGGVGGSQPSSASDGQSGASDQSALAADPTGGVTASSDGGDSS